MKIFKQILIYLIWTVIAIILGIVHMQILLEPRNVTTEELWFLWYIIYNFALFHIGARVGAIIALIFIILDVFFLKKKLTSNAKATTIRMGVLLLISIIVSSVHYVLEKVIDVI